MSQPEAAVKDVRVEVKVRNNLVLTMMNARGIDSVAELCRRMGNLYTPASVGDLINMKRPARRKNGAWTSVALALADFFQCLPEDLFSEFQQEESLERNRGYAEVAFTEIVRLTSQRGSAPEVEYQAQQLRTVIAQALGKLTPREERVIRMHFGFDDGQEKTLEEIGRHLGVTGSRVGMIEAKAFRKLKHPARSRALMSAAGSIESIPDPWNTRLSPVLDQDILDAL